MVDPCQQTPGPGNETLIFQPRYDCFPANGSDYKGKEIIKLRLFWSNHSSLFCLPASDIIIQNKTLHSRDYNISLLDKNRNMKSEKFL